MPFADVEADIRFVIPYGIDDGLIRFEELGFIALTANRVADCFHGGFRIEVIPLIKRSPLKLRGIFLEVGQNSNAVMFH